MRLQHVNLLRPVPYPVATRIQDAVVRRHIDFGLARQRAANNENKAEYVSGNRIVRRPAPFLLTFQSTPTYTCGRREISGISEDRISYLEAGERAAFHTSLRGGQTTFHGPGQVTAYLVLNLHAHGLRPRCYVRFLEDCVISVCARLGVPAITTVDPGVWLAKETSPTMTTGNQAQNYLSDSEIIDPEGSSCSNYQSCTNPSPSFGGQLHATDSKLCAVGVHMRRGITSHGLGLNVNPDLAWFDRIVACGLVGKKVTSLLEATDGGTTPKSQGLLGTRQIAMLLADTIASRLRGVDGHDVVDLAGSADQPPIYSAPPV